MKHRNVTFSITLLALGFFALSPTAEAVSPPPDGGYPNFNTAEGQNTLLSLDTSTGVANTAVGALSLQSSVNSSFNTAVGAGTLSLNTGNENTAVGAAALLLNTTGEANTAVAVDALLNNTLGVAALLNNIDGNSNTAVGLSALHDNTSGSSNSAEGDHALFSNVDGNGNTASGDSALNNNTNGDSNTAVGEDALFANTTGSINTALGLNAGSNLTTGDNNIDIGANVNGVTGESNTIRIGNTDISSTFIRGISGQTIPSGSAVLVAANGQLGTATSSKRFKDEIKPMDKASEALFSLKPVTFRYKKEIDPAGTQQFGLVAEDVERVNPDLVVRDEHGQVNTVRYDAVNAMLLNEFLKERRKVQQLEATLADEQKEFQSKLAKQEKQIAALASGLQKVSVGLEISRPAQELVLSNP
jgi:Chaperone of endosialidase